MFSDEIIETIADFKEAKENVDRICEEYKNEPDLLNFYLPSAKFMVEQIEKHIKYLFEKETGINLSNSGMQKKVDIWIRLEGKQFKDGKGPIGMVGSYLQKLNNANKHAVSILSEMNEKLISFKDLIGDLASFNLVATEKGSLKIGLSTPNLSNLKESFSEQTELFNNKKDIDPEDFPEIENIAIQGFQLLAKTVASVNDEEIFNDLKETFQENEMKKLFHFAKELVPSSRSPFDFISFEGNLGLPDIEIRTDKLTRKSLIEREKQLHQDSKYVNGTGWVRAVDLDEKTISIRPFHYNNITLQKIECRLISDSVQADFIGSLLDRFVSLSGFMFFNQNNSPLRIDVDELTIEDYTDSEE